MLTKWFDDVLIPGTPARAEQAYSKTCPPSPETGGGGYSGGGGGTVSPPREVCQTVFVYGPYTDPQSSQQEILGTRTVCFTI